MYEVCPRLGIVQFQPIDLSGEAKQTSHDRNTSAPLFLQLSPVSELLYELTYSGNALRVSPAVTRLTVYRRLQVSTFTVQKLEE